MEKFEIPALESLTWVKVLDLTGWPYEATLEEFADLARGGSVRVVTICPRCGSNVDLVSVDEVDCIHCVERRIISNVWMELYE